MAGFVRMDSGRMLDELLGGGASFPGVRGGGGNTLRPMLVDVSEHPDCFEMLVRQRRRTRASFRGSQPCCCGFSLLFCAKVDVPGVPKENLTLEVEGQTVKISATPTAEEAAKEAGESGANITWHRIERSTLYAPRALRFPENADMHAITAHADDGVLRLRIAKVAEAKRDRTVVKVE